MYNPNEPRDAEGKWTDGGDAIRAAASDKKEFKAATNKEDAAQRLINAGVKEFDLKGMDMSHVNSILEAVEKMPKDAIPDTFGNGAFWKRQSGFRMDRKADSWYGVALTGEYFDRGTGNELKGFSQRSHMAINSTTFKTTKDITNKKEAYNKLYKNKFGNDYFFNTDGRLTPFHELGHIYDQRKFKFTDKQDWKDIADKWHKESRHDILKSHTEAWAEAWADYHGNNGKRIPDYVKEYIKKKL